ncbi:MAG: DUF996 domain-containing protein, partial [Nitrososphaerota archaeon]|nr:DUF996 domain-containing protein [Nitrososphaerota archaeon]
PASTPPPYPRGDWVGLIVWALTAIAVVWVLLTVSGVFLRLGYDKIGRALHVGLFSSAGLLFLVGAATTIVVVGFLLIPVSLIRLAVAFFSINENAPVGAQPAPIPT